MTEPATRARRCRRLGTLVMAVLLAAASVALGGCYAYHGVHHGGHHAWRRPGHGPWCASAHGDHHTHGEYRHRGHHD